MSIENFRLELQNNGYEPVHELRVDSAIWERLKYNGETAGKASGGYRLTQNPDGSMFANYGSPKDPLGFRSWRSDSTRELSWGEISAAKAAREQHRRFVAEKERVRHERIGRMLTGALEWMSDATSAHPYLADKQVQAHGIKLRSKTGDLVIPRYGINGKIYSIQTIKQKKKGVKSWKQYFSGGKIKGTFYVLGEIKDIILIGEGFSTCASVFEATGIATVVAFDAGNLKEVAIGFKKKYPHSMIVFCADNDQY